jgi:hypothetical protein
MKLRCSSFLICHCLLVVVIASFIDFGFGFIQVEKVFVAIFPFL